MKSAIILIALATGASALDLGDAKNRPVTKVVNLLKDMQSQLEKEADDDDEVFDKMACWCETNDKEKTKSIAEGENRAVDLSAAIEEGIANSARLTQEVKATEGEIAKNTKALDSATSLRGRQLAEFNTEEKDMLQSISALKSAVLVLGRHHEAMLQTKVGAEVWESNADSNAFMNVAVMLKHELHKHADLLREVILPAQKKAINAFLEVDQPASAGSYAPQSGQVFGILKNMKETFEANLAASQRDESDNQKAFEDLKAAKNDEISAGQTQLQDKTLQLGNTDEKLANDRQDLEDTQNSLDADRKYLANLKDRCQNMDQEFAERQKTRAAEIAAVSKATSILNGDDAHDTFTKTFNPALIQKAAASHSARRNRAYKVLKAAATKTKDHQLSAVAMQVKLAGFGKVKDTLEAMIGRLDQEKEDEIQKKDWCIDEMNENEHSTSLNERSRDGLVAKIDDLTSTIDTLTAAINTLKAEIAEMQVQLKRASEDREAANKEFQMTVSDQRATQKLLTDALNVLKGFYDKAALLQRAGAKQEPAGPPPPPGFKSYENNSASGGVMGMLEGIINDAKAMEQEAIHGEEDAQGAYEDFVKDTNDSIDQKTLDITNKSETKAQAEADKSEADGNLEGVLSELMMLANENADLHSSCDFVLKNFDVRQQARDEEIEALKESIAILSGAKAGFLQRK